MLCFDIQLVCSIGDSFGRGSVCLILAVLQIRTSFQLWMFDMRSSSMQGANICFLPTGFYLRSLQSKKKRREEECKYPMILEYFGKFICANPSWYLTAVSCLVWGECVNAVIATHSTRGWLFAVQDTFRERLVICCTKYSCMCFIPRELDNEYEVEDNVP